MKVDTLEKAGANVGRGSGHSKQHYVTVTEVLKTRLLDVTKEFKDILTLRTEVSSEVTHEVALVTVSITHQSGASYS